MKPIIIITAMCVVYYAVNIVLCLIAQLIIEKVFDETATTEHIEHSA
jgi:hypothetical protein